MAVPRLPPASSSTASRCLKALFVRLQWRGLALVGILFLCLQYFNVLGPSNIGDVQDPPLAWVRPYYQDFDFSLAPTDKCRQALQTLEKIAKTDDQTAWLGALEACHGPLPHNDRDALEELTLDHFWKNLKACGLDKDSNCVPEWSQQIQKAGLSDRQLRRLFVETAKCALQTKFPLHPQLDHSTMPTLKQTGWKPKRIVLLALTLGPEGATTMACHLVTTALTRGWNVTLVQGPHRGKHYKFSDTLAALQGVLQLEPAIAAQDTLVVYADALDTLIQQSPQTILKKYLHQPYQFVFSAHDNCAPMGTFPYSLAAEDYICDHLFPYGDATSLRSGPQYVHTGGWMANAAAAAVVLKELIQHVSPNDPCWQWGQDQLLGSVAFLRHRDKIGMDVNSEIWAGGSAQLMDKQVLTLKASTNRTNNQAYCHHEHHFCPGMLHFNGPKTDASLQSAFDVLSSNQAIQKCPIGAHLWGSLTLLQRTKGTVKTIYKDAHLEQGGHKEWNQCLAGKACFGR